MHRICFRQVSAAAVLTALAAFMWALAPCRTMADGDATVPSSEYAVLNNAITAGMNNITLEQSDTLTAGTLSNTVISIGGGYTLSVNNVVLDGGAITGGTVAGNVYLASGAALTSSCTGTVFIPLTLPAGVPAGAAVLFFDGSSDADGDGWYDRSKTIVGYSSGGVNYTASGERIYTISYKDETGKKLSSGKNPSTYTASSGTVTVKALPDMTGYAFKGWYCDTIDENNYILNYTFSAASVCSNLIFTAAYEESGAAGGLGGKTGSTGGGTGGSSAATAAAGVSTEASAADAPAQPLTADSSADSGTFDMRMQVANSRTKSTLTKTDAANGGLTIESFQPEQVFPWEWVAVCVLLSGGAVLLTVFIKKRADERTAAMHEKLHITD